MFPFLSFEETVFFVSLAPLGKNGVRHGTPFLTGFYDALCRFPIDGNYCKSFYDFLVFSVAFIPFTWYLYNKRKVTAD